MPQLRPVMVHDLLMICYTELRPPVLGEALLLQTYYQEDMLSHTLLTTSRLEKKSREQDLSDSHVPRGFGSISKRICVSWRQLSRECRDIGLHVGSPCARRPRICAYMSIRDQLLWLGLRILLRSLVCIVTATSSRIFTSLLNPRVSPWRFLQSLRAAALLEFSVVSDIICLILNFQTSQYLLEYFKIALVALV